MIAVLFARADSVYKTIPECDVYDIERDARTWAGGCQVVAHPPCRAWGRLRTFAKPRKGERLLATWSVRQVRKWGGYWNTRPALCCGQKLVCQQSAGATNSADGRLEFTRTNGGIGRRKQHCFTSSAASPGTYRICRRLSWEKRHTSSRPESATTTAHRTAAHAKKRWQADPFAMWKAVARTTGFNQEEQVQCALPVRLAWDALRNGGATPEDIATLTDVIAICIVASEKMDALVQETCDAARIALSEVADRFTRVKRWGVDANALRDIPPIVDLYEELLRNATGGQMEQWLTAVREVKGRM